MSHTADPKPLRRRDRLRRQIRTHKAASVLYVVLRGLVIATMVVQFFHGNFENVFLCALTLVLLIVPSFIEVNFHLDLPDTLEIIILLFIFAAEILGEIQAYYIKIPHWDTMLHTLNGFLCAAVGFSLVDLLNRNERFTFRLSPAFLALVAFCFSMTIGVLWEFFECFMDLTLHFDMQKDTVIHSISSVMLDPNGGNTPTAITGITEVTVNGQPLGLGGYLDIGLLDTMKDLFVNFIGAVVFSTIGYFYVKTKGSGRFARRFIPRIHPGAHADRGAHAATPLVTFVGKSGTGKTTYLERLIPLLKARGLRLAVVKHDAHGFSMDVPGKDTYRFAEAGADTVAISSANRTAILSRPQTELTLDQLLAQLPPADLILTEGYKSLNNPKIEIHRAALNRPLLTPPEQLIAVVTDEPLEVPCPQLSFEDLDACADLLLAFAGLPSALS